ncbi:hypothetical protein DPMN_074887 [Dreissena polymorpha]|uniref:Uncharacterized protein n=1 Tax=Dreissena polymorpha TaxID=45954 RepID=A0A9D3YIJ5_DREPO|nr:hypothetical protein DPMN_074887 [Dreissena polymorpha]
MDSPLPLNKHLKWTLWKVSTLQLKHILISRTYSAMPMCEASDPVVDMHSDVSEVAIAGESYSYL